MPTHILLGWLPLHTCHLTHNLYMLSCRRTQLPCSPTCVHAHTHTTLLIHTKARMQYHTQADPPMQASLHAYVCMDMHSPTKACRSTQHTPMCTATSKTPAAIPHVHAHMSFYPQPHVHLRTTLHIHARAWTYTMPIYIYPCIYAPVSA